MTTKPQEQKKSSIISDIKYRLQKQPKGYKETCIRPIYPIFVYGTLKEHRYWYNRLRIGTYVRAAFFATCIGKLYGLMNDLGEPVVPFLITKGVDASSRVFGEVFDIYSPYMGDVLYLIDSLEIPAGYKRILINVWDGKRINDSLRTESSYYAWAYIYTGSLEGLSLIKSGEF